MFYSLQNYTEYSILSGLGSPREWVERASELGYPALGISDKATLGGFVAFQMACDEFDIKPIFGAEFAIVDDVSAKERKTRGNLLFYVKDETGFENLITLNNFAHDNERGFYYRARLDLATIKEHSEGLICVLPHDEGYMSEFPTKIEQGLKDLEAIFGDDFYYGRNSLYDEAPLWEDYRFDDKCVPTYNCHYPTEERDYLHKVVRACDTNTGRGMSHNLDRRVEAAFLPRPEDIYDYTKGLQEIYDKCNYTMEFGNYKMPPVPEDIDLLIAKALAEGWSEKLNPAFLSAEDIEQIAEDYSAEPMDVVFNNLELYRGDLINSGSEIVSDVYIDRLKYEYGVIKELGFVDYFYIVRDICKHADTLGDNVRGPARGSAAGSLFSYLTDITKVDPLEQGLLFERFLNPDRNDLPDIDLDFSSEARDQIKEYIREKYGEYSVCNIGTYDRFKIASAVKMIAQAYNYGIPDNAGNIISYNRGALDAVFADQFVTQTARGERELEERLGYANFREFYDKHRNWFDRVIMPLQDTICNKGIHAAGVLVTPDSLDKCVPCFKRSNGTIVSQWRDRHCEAVGYPKFDILAIKGIDIIAYASKLIKERHDEQIPDFDELDLDDELAMGIFQDLKMDGVFQFKSFAQHVYIEKLQPQTFDELVAATALVRPGPQSAKADEYYIELQHGRVQPVYDHPALEEVLGETGGLLVYQEQVMEVVKKIGGLTASEADYVRKACGKKKLKEMQKWEAIFKDGAEENGYSRELADELWNKIVAFAEYGFNKSHAVSYALIGYFHAWIKARYPVEFWCAALKYATDDSNKYESVYNLKSRALQEGFEIIYPNIYGFSGDFKPAADEQIYWPLSAIKGIGPKAQDALTDHGKRNAFDSIEEMLKDLPGRTIHRGLYNTLITAGFFDPISDGKPYAAADMVYSERERVLGKKDAIPFSMKHQSLIKWHRLRNEAYGFIVVPWHEIAPFHSAVMKLTEDEFRNMQDGDPVFIAGFVEDIRIYAQKNNKDKFYARMTLVDEGVEYTVMLWSSFWMQEKLDREKNRPEKGDLIEIIGEKSSWGSRAQVTVSKSNNYLRKLL